MELREPWWPLTSKDAQRAEAELRHEAHHLHPLARAKARCLARRQDRDEFLFELEHGWAIVHLTWQRESDATFPPARFFESEADVIAQLQRDALDFASADAPSN